MATGWAFHLARAKDLEVFGPMHDATGRNISYDLNKTGQAGCAIPTLSQFARQVATYKTALVVTLDDDWRWSGLINSRSIDFAAGQMTINAVGWFDRFMYLSLQENVSFTGDAGTIVGYLIDKAHEQDPDLYITLGTVETTQDRAVTYQRGQSIGQAIIDLCNIESGFDWELDPKLRQINIYARIGQDNPDCKWIYVRGEPGVVNNCTNIVDSEGGPIANDIRPSGKFGRGYAPDFASIFDYGVYQDMPTLSSVVDQKILDAYANAEIVYRARPQNTYTISPKASSAPNVPIFGKTFELGDTTYVTARRDGLGVTDQAVRAFGLTLSITDASNVQQISNLQTRYS